MRYRIEIDDDDREEFPHAPWNAALLDQEGEMALPEAGLGATPAEAVRNLIRNWSES